VTHRPTRLLIALFALALTGAGFWYLNRPEPVAVITVAAAPGLVEETVANTRAGTVKACRRARLSPGIGGQIAVLDIRAGDQVKAGRLLLSLWNNDLMAEIVLNEAESIAVHANARSACLQAEVARREADRRAKLHQQGALSEDSIDKAETEARVLQARCESAHASARVASARVDVIKTQLERTRLIAPFDGVVAEVNGELNEYVTPSPPGIATRPAVDLIDNTCFYMAAPIDEVDAPKVMVGQSARISLDAFGDHFFAARVRRIAPYVLDLEKQARTVDVEVEFTQPKDIEVLLAGYSADVEIILNLRRQSLRIPSEAILENDQVYLFLPDQGLLEKRRIETGLSNWDYTEVVQGLQAGDLVVISVDRDGIEDGAPARQEEVSSP